MSDDNTIEIVGLDEAIAKYEGSATGLQKALRTTMRASLYAIQQSVKPYPPPPANSTYRRTGTLGRSLGVNQGGGPYGKPDVYSIAGEGTNIVGRFGSNLIYAPDVIGDPPLQEDIHKGRWWTISDIAEASRSKVLTLWNITIQKILEKSGS